MRLRLAGGGLRLLPFQLGQGEAEFLCLRELVEPLTQNLGGPLPIAELGADAGRSQEPIRLGGPAAYKGRSMKAAHAHLPIAQDGLTLKEETADEYRWNGL